MTGPDGRSHSARVSGREALTPPLPKRFYKTVSVRRVEVPAEAEGHPPSFMFAVHLDGRSIRTPGKRALRLPSKPLASAIAGEWAAQGEVIDPGSMPLTKLANTAIDAVAGCEQAVAADIVAYAGRDLLCYRATSPRDLIEFEAANWDPLLAWAEAILDVRLVVARGVMPVEQDARMPEAFANALQGRGAFELAALHVMTTLTGSAILALAVAKGRLSAAAAWEAAHTGEDWQSRRWGDDADASARRGRRWREMEAAGLFLVPGRVR